MSKLRVETFLVSVDGFSTGLNQSFDKPFGEGGMELSKWFMATKTFQKMFGHDQGTTGIDDTFASRGFPATIWGVCRAWLRRCVMLQAECWCV